MTAQETWWSKPLRVAVNFTFVCLFNEKNHCLGSIRGESFVRGLWDIDKTMVRVLSERTIDSIDHSKKFTKKQKYR